MKRVLLIFLPILAACHNDLSEGRVKEDFHRVVESKYPGVSILGVERIDFGDGWDDGVEVKVLFEGECDKSAARLYPGQEICSGKPVALLTEMSYQRGRGGDWQVLAAKIAVRSRTMHDDEAAADRR